MTAGDIIGRIREFIIARQERCKNIPEEANCEDYYMRLAEAKAMESALEKQIPKKPIFQGDGYAPDGTFIYDEWLCPGCNEMFEVDYDDYQYCPTCGQAIDWSEEE